MTVELQLAYMNEANLSIPVGGFARPPVPGMEKDLLSKSAVGHKNSWLSQNNNNGKLQHRNVLNSDAVDRTDSITATPNVHAIRKATPEKHRTLQSTSNSDNSYIDVDRSRTQANNHSDLIVPNVRGVEKTYENVTSYLRWAESLMLLLEDSEGVILFKQFLDQENCAALLDFWFACCGVQMVSDSDLNNLVKLIFKRYIKGNQLNLKADIRKRIVDRLKGGSAHVDRTILEEAKQDVENAMNNDMYPLFLKSDIYLQYVQSYNESPKTSSSVSSTRPMSSAALPTLPEEEELRQEDILSPEPVALSLTSNNLAATIGARSNHATSSEGYFAVPSRIPNPYHVYTHNSYVPTSAQDSASEMQSLSSDALTEDTVSQADSAIDGRDSKKWRRHLMRKNAHLNRHAENQQQFIPRTERLPKDRSFAESNPDRFAALLIEKLQSVKEEEDMMERLQEKIRHIEASNTDEEAERRLDTTTMTQAGNKTLQLSLMASMLADSEMEDNAQSILDNHMSRIWESTGQTPCRSPGDRHSPPHLSTWSPVRARRSLMPLTLSTNASNELVTGIKSKRRETMHIVKQDSYSRTAETDILHKTTQSHNKGHQNKYPGSDSAYSSQANEAIWYRPTDARVLSSSSGRRDTESSYSTGDSGASSAIIPLAPHDPANDKVVKWMMSNEVSSDKPPQYSTDASEKSSTGRKSNKSGNVSMPYKGPTSASKKESEVSWSVPYASDHMRSTKHSLNLTQPAFSSSMTGSFHNHDNFSVSHREQPLDISVRSNRHPQKPSTNIHDLSMPVSSHQSRQITRVSPSAPLDLSSDRSASVERHQQQIGNMTSRNNVAPQINNVVPQMEMTVIGYYFCGDEIPYRTTLPGKEITLSQFKQLITKKGNFRYFFKTLSNEFDTGIVHMEVVDDDALLPLYDGKIICKVEKVE